MELEFKNAELENIYNLAKKHGLKVYANLKKFTKFEKLTYLYITDGTKIVYCEASYSGVSFSSVHKPQPNQGSGYRLSDGMINHSIEDIREFLNAGTPQWAMRFGAVQRWASWEDYDKNRVQILKYEEI